MAIVAAGVMALFAWNSIAVLLLLAWLTLTILRIWLGQRDLGLTKASSWKLWDDRTLESNILSLAGDKPNGDSKSPDAPISPSQLIALMVVDSAEVVERITQRVEPQTRALKITLDLHIHLPKTTRPGPTQIPILLQRKGKLFDDFELSGSSRIYPPSHESTIHPLCDTVSKLADAVGHGDAYNRYYASFINGLIRHHMSGDKDQDESFMDASMARIEGFRRFMRSAPSPSTEAIQVSENERNAIADTAAAMASRLMTHYPICIEVDLQSDTPTNMSVTISYRLLQRRTNPIINPASGMLRRLSNFLARGFDTVRWALGARSSTFQFPLDLAGAASSFHLEVMGPRGHYLMKQAIEPSVSRVDYSYLRLRRLMGQRYCHIYTRRWQGHPDHNAVLQFNERMPGSVGTALITSIGTAIAVFCSGYSVAHNQGSENDLSVLILALPAAAAGWFTVDHEGGSLSQTLASTVSTMTSFIVCSLSLLALFLDTSTNADYFGFDTWWWTLLVASSIVTMLTLSCWVRRSIVEATIIGSHHKDDWNRRTLS